MKSPTTRYPPAPPVTSAPLNVRMVILVATLPLANVRRILPRILPRIRRTLPRIRRTPPRIQRTPPRIQRTPPRIQRTPPRIRRTLPPRSKVVIPLSVHCEVRTFDSEPFLTISHFLSAYIDPVHSFVPSALLLLLPHYLPKVMIPLHYPGSSTCRKGRTE